MVSSSLLLRNPNQHLIAGQSWSHCPVCNAGNVYNFRVLVNVLFQRCFQLPGLNPLISAPDTYKPIYRGKAPKNYLNDGTVFFENRCLC